MAHEYFWHPLMAIFWAIVVLVIAVAILRRTRRGGWHHRCGRGALELLRERYAKGEISTPEFEERKKALMAE